MSNGRPMVSARPVFVGREQELDAVLGAVDDAAGGRAVLVVVEAEAGAGKSSLLAQAAVALRGGRAGQTVEVLATGGDPNDPRALHCLAEALRDRPPTGDAALERLSELLRRGGGARPESVTAALQELIVDVVERLAMAAPTVLIVDDLHWADDATVAAIGSILRRMRGLPLAVVCATRPSARITAALAASQPGWCGWGRSTTSTSPASRRR